MHVNQASVLFLNSHSDSLKRDRGGMAFPNHFQCTAHLCFTQHVLKFESFPSPLSLTFCSVNRKSPKIIPGRNSNATKMQKINFNSS